MMADDSLTTLRELVARHWEHELFRPAMNVLTYIADPEAKEALAKKIDPHAFATTTTGQYTCWNGDERRCLALATANDQLNLLARKAMETE